jgi:hypothetical protein
VGALWPLPDEPAGDFAAEFYASLHRDLDARGSASVANLMRRNRSIFQRTGNPTFLAYVYYGDPTFRFRRHHADKTP